MSIFSPFSSLFRPVFVRFSFVFVHFLDFRINFSARTPYLEAYKMDFIPSVGPGYEDTAVRPWNKVHTQKRENGDYYSVYFQKAISLRPKFITVTSFNEWHEGTQIEPAGMGDFCQKAFLFFR